MCPRDLHKTLSSISHSVFPCLYEMWRTEVSCFVPSLTDHIKCFVKTTCTAKGHPWTISESQHLYTVMKPVMTVCEIHYQPDLQHRSQLTCAAGVWSTGHDTGRRMGDWYYAIWMSPGLQYNHLSAHCLWIFVAFFICCHPKCLDVNESSPLEVSRLCFSERENQTPDCSCQVEGKLCLIEGAASAEQKNSFSVLRLTPLTWSLEIKGEKYQEKMDSVIQGGRALHELV